MVSQCGLQKSRGGLKNLRNLGSASSDFDGVMMGKGLQEVSVLLIEPHRPTRNAWKVIVEGTGWCRCVGAYSNLAQALRALTVNGPHVTVIGPSINVSRVLNNVVQIRDFVTRTKVIVCNTFTQSNWVVDLLKVGVSGCVVKNAPIDHFTTAIGAVAGGGAWFSPSCARIVVDYFEQLPGGDGDVEALLTQREIDVMILARRGLGHKQIAGQLGLSYDTVRTHFRNIYRKLNCRSRSEAVAKYYGF